VNCRRERRPHPHLRARAALARSTGTRTRRIARPHEHAHRGIGTERVVPRRRCDQRERRSVRLGDRGARRVRRHRSAEPGRALATQLSFAFDARETYSRLYPLLDNIPEAQLRVAYGARDQYVENKKIIDNLELAFQTSLIALGAQTLLWVGALAVA
jgi:hypothetical protein